jgi:uncharacterized membrane protein HdeD (DUF308 family)
MDRMHVEDTPAEPVAGQTITESTAPGIDVWNTVLRVVAGAAGAVMLVIGLVAVARLDWSQGFDAFPVEVAGMPFSPLVAIVTAVAGLLALVAGAVWDRESKLVMGGVLICVGIAVFIADTASRADLVDRHGWMALVVGIVLVAAGLLLRPPARRRTVVTW